MAPAWLTVIAWVYLTVCFCCAGIIFQYFAIAPMRGLGLKDSLTAATKADFLSLTAFEIGLFGWMAIMAFVLFPHRTTWYPARLPTGSSCRLA